MTADDRPSPWPGYNEAGDRGGARFPQPGGPTPAEVEASRQQPGEAPSPPPVWGDRFHPDAKLMPPPQMLVHASNAPPILPATVDGAVARAHGMLTQALVMLDVAAAALEEAGAG